MSVQHVNFNGVPFGAEVIFSNDYRGFKCMLEIGLFCFKGRWRKTRQGALNNVLKQYSEIQD